MPLDPILEERCLEALVIDRALQLLGPNGEHWTQGKLHDSEGSYCMIGAILFARGQLRIKDDRTIELVVEAFSTSEFIPEGAGDMPEQISEIIQEFNDREGRPFEHIDQVLRKARAMAVARC
jgi:hypothetical protein